VSQGRADATAEIEAADILEDESIEDGGSIAPVMLVADDPSEPSLPRAALGAEETVHIRGRGRRQAVLRGVAIGVVGLCATLLVAVGVRARDVGASVAGTARATGQSAAAAPATPTRHVDYSAWVPVQSPGATPEVASFSTVTVSPSMGQVLVDGKRLGAQGAIVACGSHAVRIGRGPLRKVEVPCGGNIAIERGRISVK
jgi:hypothetical protein